MNTQNSVNTGAIQNSAAYAAGLSAVSFWQFGYGFYYSQAPNRL